VRLLSGRHDSRTFEVVEISPNQAYLKHLLHEFDADIQHKARPWSATSPEPQDTALADCSRADIPLYRLCRSPTTGLRYGCRGTQRHLRRSAVRAASCAVGSRVPLGVSASGGFLWRGRSMRTAQ
jgi:hypothetical protein